MDFTIKAVSPQGYPVTLTIQDDDSAALMKRASDALEWLKSKSFTPPQAAAAPAPAANGNGQPGSKICPVHHVVMKRRSGQGGDVWYSHKAINPSTNEEYWCRGKEK